MSKQDLAKQLELAQLTIVERALIAFVEDVFGKVPTDAQIISLGQHIQFADSPLSVFEKDDRRFTKYYCWADKHILALGFLDPTNPLVLYVVKVKPEEWPVALRLFLEQKKEAE